MWDKKQSRDAAVQQDVKIGLADLLVEIAPGDLSRALRWSGAEIIKNPKIGEFMSNLLIGDRDVTKVVLGISANSGVPPPYVHNTLTSGFIMGIALVVELLNKEEEDPFAGDIPMSGPVTIQ